MGGVLGSTRGQRARRKNVDSLWVWRGFRMYPTCRFSSPKTNSFLVVAETKTRYSLGVKKWVQEQPPYAPASLWNYQA